MKTKRNNTISQETLDKAHQIMFEMLCEVDRIFRKHQVRYCIAFGTLLGAVRNKGFIPWDDDIDIHVFNEDYDLALKVLGEELDNVNYILHSKENDPLYWYTTAKVKSLRTFVSRVGLDKEKDYKYRGVWISLLVAQKAKRYNRFNYWLLKVLQHAHDYNIHQKGTLNLIKVLFCKISLPLLKIIYGLIEFIPGKQIRILGNTGWRGEFFNEEDIYPFTELEFMGKMFYAPKDYKKILIGSFGEDYMTPLSPEKRVLHFKEIVFK